MQREIVSSVDQEDTRLAILENGRLAEIYIERPLTQRVVGNIYMGRVENVLPGMQAAFVDIGLERNAFLFVDDAHPSRGKWNEDGHEGSNGEEGEPRRALIQELVEVGQEIMVQVAKEPTGAKGARVTRNLTLPGRYLVLMPMVDYIGISRRISNETERERLKDLARQTKPRGLGFIVRTAAEGVSEEDFLLDADFLKQEWNRIRRKARKAKGPQLLHHDPSLLIRVLRDQLSDQMQRIVLDDPAERERVSQFLEHYAQERLSMLEFFDGPPGTLFSSMGLEDEIERALQRKVWLKSGGYLVIDQAEALTAIDVNTGKYIGSQNKSLEDTIFQTNLEAAAEISRQLRLRDIGGIIVIDFIDMEQPDHRQEVVAALEKHLQADRTKTSVLGFTQLGLVEMTRKKGRQNLLHLLTRPCQACEGRGRVLSEESISRRVRSRIKRLLQENNAEALLVEVHPSVASLLIGPSGVHLKQLEKETGRYIYVRGSEQCSSEQMEIRAMGDRSEVEALALPVRAGEVLLIEVEEAHVANPADGIARVEGYVIHIEGAGDYIGQTIHTEIVKVFRTYAKARIVKSAEANA